MLSDYERTEKICEGTYGEVYKGKKKRTGQIVILKKIRLENEDKGLPSSAIREVSVLKKLKHPNVVSLLEVIYDNKKLHLVFEFLSTDLRKWLESLPEKELPSSKLAKSYLNQMLKATAFCHQKRIIHRDLKPQNILLDLKGNLKLADFGLARTFGIPLRQHTHEVFTLWYRAPEVLLGTIRYSTPVDIWSIGCIFAEMVTKKPLFHETGDSEIEQLFRIYRTLSTPDKKTWPGISKLPEFKPTFPVWKENVLESLVEPMEKSGIDLLKDMLIYDPKKRISSKEALKHPYFDDLDLTLLSDNKSTKKNHLITDYYKVTKRKTTKTLKEEQDQMISYYIKNDIDDVDSLKIQEFKDKGRGVVTLRKFTKGSFICEYRGDLIDIQKAKEREKAYETQKLGCYMYYFSWSNKQWCIDATADTGRLGRLINHSRKKPNLKTKLFILNDKPHLIFIALDDIEENTELLYDYGETNRCAIEAHPWIKNT